MSYTEEIPIFQPLTGVQTLQINIKNLIDDVQCYQTVRELTLARRYRLPLLSVETRHQARL